MCQDTVRIRAELKKHGLLLRIDANLPNVSALIAGERVRGSWWAHPKGRVIFRVSSELDDDPDVLITKLVSGKITYVDQSFWPAVVTVGRAREPWQIASLSPDARQLLSVVDRKPVQPDGVMSKAAAQLETMLLVYSNQFHGESGAHVRQLESWDHWARRVGLIIEPIAVADARRRLEEALALLNQDFKGAGRLPWQGKAAAKTR